MQEISHVQDPLYRIDSIYEMELQNCFAISKSFDIANAFCARAHAVTRASLICIAVQRGATVSSERLHGGTVAPERIDGLGASLASGARTTLTYPRTHANSCRHAL